MCIPKAAEEVTETTIEVPRGDDGDADGTVAEGCAAVRPVLNESAERMGSGSRPDGAELQQRLGEDAVWRQPAACGYRGRRVGDHRATLL